MKPPYDRDFTTVKPVGSNLATGFGGNPPRDRLLAYRMGTSRQEDMPMQSLVLTVLLAALAHASPTPPPETLRAFTANMLGAAATDYAKMRGKRTSAEVYKLEYALTLPAKARCAKCTITDEFAWKGHPENWFLEERWYAKGMSGPAMMAYAKKQLAPIVAKGYVLTTTGSKDYPTLAWRNDRTRMSITINIFNGGFIARVGHDAAKTAHVLATPTADDIAALRNAVTNFINLGVGPASANFTSLRGPAKPSIIGGADYTLSVSFGSLFRNCHISDASENTFKMDDYSPKWLMICDTIPMVGDNETIEAQIKSAMSEALPAGFSTTTGTTLGIDDYRWDNSTTQIAADIDEFGTFSLPKGLVSYGLGIIHFLPKPAKT
jgi:hypothetical protein